MSRTSLCWILSLVVSSTVGCTLADNGSNDTTAENGEGDDASDGDGPRDATIYEIQGQDVPDKTIVRLSQVVVTSPVNLEEGGVFVQEQDGGEFSGIYMFMYTEVVDGVPLEPGDVIDVIGEYTEFYDFSEITVRSVADITKTGSVPPLEPAVVAAADIATGGAKTEAYEGVLVRVEDVEVTDGDLGHGDFEVEGGLIVDDWFLFAAGTSPKPPMGIVFDAITGPLMYNFEEWKIAPRTLDDFVGGGGLTAEPYTIPQIQGGDVPVNSLVLVEEVVVTSPPTFEGDMFFVMDPAGGEYSGIAVFLYDPTGLQVRPGDRITVNGAYQEYYEQSQLVLESVADIEVLGTADLPPAEVVTAADVATGGSRQENYEGVLVTVEDVTVTAPANMYGEWQIEGALQVDDLFFTDDTWPEPQADAVFTSITGVMTYSFEEAKLCPPGLAEIVGG
jgi:predicted extracellular nuclease